MPGEELKTLQSTLSLIVERLIKIETRFELYSSNIEQNLNNISSIDRRLTVLESDVKHESKKLPGLAQDMQTLKEHVAEQKVRNTLLATIISMGASIIVALIVGFIKG